LLIGHLVEVVGVTGVAKSTDLLAIYLLQLGHYKQGEKEKKKTSISLTTWPSNPNQPKIVFSKTQKHFSYHIKIMETKTQTRFGDAVPNPLPSWKDTRILISHVSVAL